MFWIGIPAGRPRGIRAVARECGTSPPRTPPGAAMAVFLKAGSFTGAPASGASAPAKDRANASIPSAAALQSGFRSWGRRARLTASQTPALRRLRDVGDVPTVVRTSLDFGWRRRLSRPRSRAKTVRQCRARLRSGSIRRIGCDVALVGGLRAPGRCPRLEYRTQSFEQGRPRASESRLRLRRIRQGCGKSLNQPRPIGLPEPPSHLA